MWFRWSERVSDVFERARKTSHKTREKGEKKKKAQTIWGTVRDERLLLATHIF